LEAKDEKRSWERVAGFWLGNQLEGHALPWEMKGRRSRKTARQIRF
jgi:hypothetical protein